MEKTMAEVAYSIHGTRVFVRYKDLVEDPLTAGLTADELIAAANEVIAEESDSEIDELPAISELMSLKTRLGKEVFVAEGEESGSGSEAKYVVVASLRYMAEEESVSE